MICWSFPHEEVMSSTASFLRARRSLRTPWIIRSGINMIRMNPPVLPKLALNFLGGDAPNAAKMFGIFGTVFALMQFVFSPMLGVLSDRFGRRPVVLLSNLGLGLDYIVMALAPTLGWLFVGR